MAIVLADILDQRQVALRVRSRRRPNAIREIASLFEKTESVARPADFLAKVLAREEAGSTLAENSVAFPHARTELVDRIALAIGRSRAGIPWNNQGERARLIFLLAVP
jgi:mannitol/fructose-specific phosphotransferase system IIA component (Ntr-type)